MKLCLFTLFLTLSATAFAESICGVDVRPVAVFPARRPLIWTIDESVKAWDLPKACRQDDKLFVVVANARGMVAAYSRENSVVPPEALLSETLSEETRLTYIRQMSDRAALVVESALNSGLVTDKVVAKYLRMELDVLKKGMPVDPQPPEKNPSCQREHTITLNEKKNRSAAYVRQKDPKTKIYFCEYVYKLDSPYLFIHELVHWLRRGKLENKVTEECLADLVTKTALSAAIKANEAVPAVWNSEGAYFTRCPSEYQERFRKMNLPDSSNYTLTY